MSFLFSTEVEKYRTVSIWKVSFIERVESPLTEVPTVAMLPSLILLSL